MIDGGGVIVRTERRRRYSDAEKAAIVAESLRPDVTVVSVARRHGIAKSVIYNWRANRREAEAIAREALKFIPCGHFVATSERASASEIIVPARSCSSDGDAATSSCAKGQTKGSGSSAMANRRPRPHRRGASDESHRRTAAMGVESGSIQWPGRRLRGNAPMAAICDFAPKLAIQHPTPLRSFGSSSVPPPTVAAELCFTLRPTARPYFLPDR